MIFVKPTPELKTALVRRYRMLRGTDPSSQIGFQQSMEDLRGKVIPATIGPLYFHAIESMERKPHIREVNGNKVVIHDEAFADTLNFLEITYIGEDRPLVPWAVLARVLCEFLYVDTLPGLGLFMADCINAYASYFADADGFYERPVPVRGKYHSDPPLEKIQQEALALAEQKRRHMDIQRSIILFHEIGHALYAIDQSWREVWHTLGSKIMNIFYKSAPVDMDSEYGINRSMKMTPEEKEKINRQLIDKMEEEISCDWFALAGVILNANSWNVSLEDAIRVHWRFMLFTDLIDQVRIQASQRTQNKIRFRSLMSKLFVRTQSILSMLGFPQRIPRSNLVVDPYQIRGLLETIGTDNLIIEFTDSLEVAGKIMSWAIGGPATWEWDLHYGKFPGGYRNLTLSQGESLESRAALFNELFGDDFLKIHRESGASRVAPCCRTAGHLLCRSRIWANEFFSNEDQRQQYALLAQEDDSSDARYTLRATFEEVTNSKAKIIYVFSDY